VELPISGHGTGCVGRSTRRAPPPARPMCTSGRDKPAVERLDQSVMSDAPLDRLRPDQWPRTKVARVSNRLADMRWATGRAVAPVRPYVHSLHAAHDPRMPAASPGRHDHSSCRTQRRGRTAFVHLTSTDAGGNRSTTRLSAATGRRHDAQAGTTLKTIMSDPLPLGSGRVAEDRSTISNFPCRAQALSRDVP